MFVNAPWSEREEIYHLHHGVEQYDEEWKKIGVFNMDLIYD